MKSHQYKHQSCAGRAGLAAIFVLAAVVCAPPGTRAMAADAPNPGAMTVPPPIKDPLFTAWQGTWDGNSKLGDQAAYSELVFAPTVGGQWLEGRMRLWTDKTKKTPVMDFAMYLRPTTTDGSYKAYGVSSDGSGATATITTTNGVQTWVWNNDNDTRETATLTHVTSDHVVYEGSINDKSGTKLMDIKQDLTRRTPKVAASSTAKKSQ